MVDSTVHTEKRERRAFGAKGVRLFAGIITRVASWDAKVKVNCA